MNPQTPAFRLTSDDFTSVKLNTAIKEASGGQYDLTGDGFEIYEEDFILLREKVPDLPEWGKSQVSVRTHL